MIYQKKVRAGFVNKGGSLSNDPRIRKLDYFYLAVIYKTGEMGHITGRATGYMFRYKKDPKVFIYFFDISPRPLRKLTCGGGGGYKDISKKSWGELKTSTKDLKII
jgi:hypothetical protein